MPTQAKKAGNARHIAKLDIIKIQPYKEEGAAIRAAAAAAGISVQRYILEAVRDRMERERAESVPDGLPERVQQGTTEDEKPSPAELSPDDWAEWARRQDDEPLEDWKTRLRKSNIGTSPVGIMKRIGKLSKQDRNLILETDQV